jgi:GTP-binding protein
MSLFQNATYIASAHRLQDLPPPREPEIAFAGRSNAGKSSAINALANRTRLAFVAKRPGRTQTINLFRLAGGGILADLPGYGFAEVPEAMRRHWEATLGRYLQTRPSLCGLALVMDARHPLTERDEMMLDWFQPTGRPIHVLLTKADKLSRSEATATLERVRERLARRGGGCTAQLFSSLRRTGLAEAEAIFARWLGRPRGERSAPASAHKKAPGQRGKPGAKRLKLIKAPAQGGEAGDDRNRLQPMSEPPEKGSPSPKQAGCRVWDDFNKGLIYMINHDSGAD